MGVKYVSVQVCVNKINGKQNWRYAFHLSFIDNEDVLSVDLNTRKMTFRLMLWQTNKPDR